MARNMDNLMLEQSRTIRTDLSAVKTSVENLEIARRLVGKRAPNHGKKIVLVRGKVVARMCGPGNHLLPLLHGRRRRRRSLVRCLGSRRGGKRGANLLQPGVRRPGRAVV